MNRRTAGFAMSLALVVGPLLIAASAQASPQPTGQALAVEVQADGRIVVGGTAETCDPRTGSCVDGSLFVARYLPSGEPDLSFGDGDGSTELPISPGGVSFAGMAAGPSGSITVAGDTLAGVGSDSLVVARLRQAGDLDPSFGSGGTTSLPHSQIRGGRGNALSVTQAGRIVVAGVAPDPPDTQFAVAQLLPNGVLDPDFGNGGVSTLRVDPSTDSESANAVVELPDGRILVAGGSQPRGSFSLPGSGGFAIAQLLADGDPDPSFGGGDGRAVLAPVNEFQVLVSVRSVNLRPDGGAYLTGFRAFGQRACGNLAVANMDAGGSLAPAYADSGVATLDTPGCEAGSDGVLRESGGLVATASLAVEGARAFLAALDAGGALEGGFGGDGIAEPSTLGLSSGIAALASVSDGLVVGAGHVDSDLCLGAKRSARPCRAVLLTRIRADGQLDLSFGTDGIVTTPAVCANQHAAPCGLSRHRFRVLARRGLPETVELGSAAAKRAARSVRVRVQCKRQIDEICRVRLRLKARPDGVGLGQPTRLKVKPGKGRSVRVDLSRTDSASVSPRDRLLVKASISTENQPPISVSRRAAIGTR